MKKLYRSRKQKMLLGVCGGIAEYFDADPTIVRIAAVLLGFASAGFALIAYFIFAIVIPEAPYNPPAQRKTTEEDVIVEAKKEEPHE